MRYETCNPGQDADGVERGSTKEINGSSSFDTSIPAKNEHGVAGNSVRGDVNRIGCANSEHQRNISDATAVSPGGYVDTADGQHRINASLSPRGHSDHMSATNPAVDQ